MREKVCSQPWCRAAGAASAADRMRGEDEQGRDPGGAPDQSPARRRVVPLLLARAAPLLPRRDPFWWRRVTTAFSIFSVAMIAAASWSESTPIVENVSPVCLRLPAPVFSNRQVIVVSTSAWVRPLGGMRTR